MHRRSARSVRHPVRHVGELTVTSLDIAKKMFTLLLTPREKCRLEALAARWECTQAEALRRALKETYEREVR